MLIRVLPCIGTPWAEYLLLLLLLLLQVRWSSNAAGELVDSQDCAAPGYVLGWWLLPPPVPTPVRHFLLLFFPALSTLGGRGRHAAPCGAACGRGSGLDLHGVVGLDVLPGWMSSRDPH